MAFKKPQHLKTLQISQTTSMNIAAFFLPFTNVLACMEFDPTSFKYQRVYTISNDHPLFHFFQIYLYHQNGTHNHKGKLFILFHYQRAQKNIKKCSTTSPQKEGNATKYVRLNESKILPCINNILSRNSRWMVKKTKCNYSMVQTQRILHPSMRITLTEVSLELMVCAELGFCIEIKLKTMHRARAFVLGIPRLFGYINQIPGLYKQYLTKKQ